jgi:thiosulfate dehydrogenase [quinone] large subunit
MQQEKMIEEPKFAQWLFASRQAAVIWLVARLYLGYEWLHAGFGKVTGTEGGTWSWHFGFTSDSWLRSAKPLQGFLGHALSTADGGANSSLNYGWYASFLRWLAHPVPAAIFSRAIALGEMAIGIAMIVGLFVGYQPWYPATMT